MNAVAHLSPIRDTEHANSLRMTTTLYDLIATIHTILGTDQDDVVVMAVDHLLRKSRVTFIENSATRVALLP